MLNRSFKFCTFYFGIFALALVPIAARAQVLYGSLTGNVTDPSGGAVPNAKVDVSSTATGVTKQGTTDDRGGVLISDLQAGVYKVTITAPSFSSTVQDGVQVTRNTVRRLDVQLQVAAVGQSVTIAESTTVLQTDRADVRERVVWHHLVGHRREATAFCAEAFVLAARGHEQK